MARKPKPPWHSMSPEEVAQDLGCPSCKRTKRTRGTRVLWLCVECSKGARPGRIRVKLQQRGWNVLQLLVVSTVVNTVAPILVVRYAVGDKPPTETYHTPVWTYWTALWVSLFEGPGLLSDRQLNEDAVPPAELPLYRARRIDRHAFVQLCRDDEGARNRILSIYRTVDPGHQGRGVLELETWIRENHPDVLRSPTGASGEESYLPAYGDTAALTAEWRQLVPPEDGGAS